MMWTAIVKAERDKTSGTESLQFSGPHGFQETYKRLMRLGYQPLALVKGTHTVALRGGEESTPKTIGHI